MITKYISYIRMVLWVLLMAAWIIWLFLRFDTKVIFLLNIACLNVNELGIRFAHYPSAKRMLPHKAKNLAYSFAICLICAFVMVGVYVLYLLVDISIYAAVSVLIASAVVFIGSDIYFYVTTKKCSFSE